MEPSATPEPLFCDLRAVKLRLVFVLCALLLTLICSKLGIASDVQNPEYKLGPEDVILVTVLGHEDLSGDYYVPSDGLITIPRVGQIQVTGKTLADLSQTVTEGVSKFLRRPDVSVKLKSPRPQAIYITGAVAKPGPYDLKPGWHITDVIGAAGGIAPNVQGADCTVTVLHGATGMRESAPLLDITKGDETKNVLVQLGDMITVETVEQIPVYVMGKVRSPGLYSLRKPTAGVLEALTVAGGPLDEAALSKVTVTHLDGQTETVNLVSVTIEGKQTTPLKLRAGDMVVVPESLARFAVLGWVNSPGFFALKENEPLLLSEAIGMAKGSDNKRGGLSKVAIIHTADGKQQRKIYDVSKFLKNGDITQNPTITAGDVVFVPETNKPDWDRVLAGLSSSVSMIWALGRF